MFGLSLVGFIMNSIPSKKCSVLIVGLMLAFGTSVGNLSHETLNVCVIGDDMSLEPSFRLDLPDLLKRPFGSMHESK
jgi:hypothetical protein